MTADIELLPLPRTLQHADDADLATHVQDYARANVAHATAAKDAEIEALRAEVEMLRALLLEACDDGDEADADLLATLERARTAQARAERLAEALRLIAAPKRQDGTWNRDREACRQIAENALRDHDQEEGSGAFWGSSPKSGGPDWTGFDG